MNTRKSKFDETNLDIDIQDINSSSFCKWHEDIFGSQPAASTIREHKQKGFNNLSYNWKTKYIFYLESSEKENLENKNLENLTPGGNNYEKRNKMRSPRQSTPNKSLDLAALFSVLSIDSFISFNENVYGHKILKQTVKSHIGILWDNLADIWQIKYLSFKAYAAEKTIGEK